MIIDRVNSSSEWFAGHATAYVPIVRVNPLSDGSQPYNCTYNPRCSDATNSSSATHTCTLKVTNVGQPLDYPLYFDERPTTSLDIT